MLQNRFINITYISHEFIWYVDDSGDNRITILRIVQYYMDEEDGL